ncbi:MAG: cob(I)yrinic acid a,c-diamide adenosyltransferase [Streptococcaceae bacterium]|jgi:ATP:cob(I)alamin adenosyltransferase|nr:cob(I)yrinic acid a,c-diamide adenosyltransferase [Streptococcaceae bacterium]
MGIYTKTGDAGTTSLFDGLRVKKYSHRVDTYGTFDEVNAFISLAEKFCQRQENKEILVEIQYKLFQLCGEIASSESEKFGESSQRISEADVIKLEKKIDAYTLQLPKIKSFILPGTSIAGSHLHVARTITRRGERMLIRLAEDVDIRPVLKKFVNRLSDFLYIIARDEDNYEAQEKMIDEIIKKYKESEAELNGR